MSLRRALGRPLQLQRVLFLSGEPSGRAFGIVYRLLRRGPAMQTVPEVRRFFYPIVARVFAGGVALQHTFVVTYTDRLGLIAAFLINLVMSALHPAMALARRGHGRGISRAGAWLKMLGTIGTGIQCSWLIPYVSPEVESMSFLVAVCCAIFVLDATYVVIAHKLAARSRLFAPARGPLEGVDATPE